jgi:cysteine desulfuration protein SufE
MAESIAALKEDFSLIDEWEDRYRYVIELGRALPPLEEAERIPHNKVQGCASQVWIAVHEEKNGHEPRLSFTGDSDALIVKGLIAIIFRLFSGRPAAEILATDAGALPMNWDCGNTSRRNARTALLRWLHESNPTRRRPSSARQSDPAII